jgi:hypothetical protein
MWLGVIASGQSGSAPGSYREGVFQGGKRNCSPPDESVHWRPRVRALQGEFSGGKNAPDYPGVSGRLCLSRTGRGATPGRVGCLGVIETSRRWKGVEFWQIKHPRIFTNPIFH